MPKKYKVNSIVVLVLFFLVVITPQALASELLLRQNLPLRTDMYFSNVAKIPDPILDPKTIYGYLSTSYAADSYYFIPSRTTTISIEVLVPVRKSNELFKPAWEIVGENIPPQPMNIYFSVPPGSDYIGHDYYVSVGPRSTVIDPITLERLYVGNRQKIDVIQGKLYYINIYDPFHYIGDYVLKIGNQPEAIPLTQKGFIKDIYKIKTDQFGKQVDQREVAAVFFCIVGLLLTASSVQASKANEKLILTGNKYFTLGTILFSLAQMYLYSQSLFSSLALIQLFFLQLTIILYICYRYFPKSYLYCLTFCSIGIQVFLFTWYLLITK